MGYFRWWGLPKRAWFIILGELSVIVSLSVSLFLTYLNDVYFQSYANSLSPILIPAFSLAFGISSASVAAYLYIGIKRIQIERDGESQTKRRTNHLTRESIEVHRDSPPIMKNDSQPQQTRVRLKPMVPSNSHVRSRTHTKESEGHGSISETKKQP